MWTLFEDWLISIHHAFTFRTTRPKTPLIFPPNKLTSKQIKHYITLFLNLNFRKETVLTYDESTFQNVGSFFSSFSFYFYLFFLNLKVQTSYVGLHSRFVRISSCHWYSTSCIWICWDNSASYDAKICIFWAVCKFTWWCICHSLECNSHLSVTKESFFFIGHFLWNDTNGTLDFSKGNYEPSDAGVYSQFRKKLKKNKFGGLKLNFEFIKKLKVETQIRIAIYFFPCVSAKEWDKP